MATTITDITAATLNQLVTVRAGQILAERLPDIAGLVRIAGHLGDPGFAKGAWHYGVRLAAEGGRVLVDVPAALVAGRNIKGGEWVLVTGMVRVRAGQLGTLELRLEASDVETAEAQPSAGRGEPAGTGRMTIEALKRTRLTHRAFPVTNRALRVTLIQSSSLQAQVAQDCLAEINKLGKLAQVTQIPVNMLDAAAIAKAIANATGDILLLIRGGGDASDFDVFDDNRVVTALARLDAYRVIGLGHSGNATLLDLVADFAARTPAQAGLHVREAVERVVRQWEARQRELRGGAARPTGGAIRSAWSFRALVIAVASGVLAGLLLALGLG